MSFIFCNSTGSRTSHTYSGFRPENAVRRRGDVVWEQSHAVSREIQRNHSGFDTQGKNQPYECSALGNKFEIPVIHRNIALYRLWDLQNQKYLVTNKTGLPI
jgi:hypothetical protein